jgi:integrase
MYFSKFAADMENMLTSLHNGGLQVAYINYFLADFDAFCIAEFPGDSVLTRDIAEKWIHSATSDSKAHMSRRVRTMKHIGEYQRSLGKTAYVPDYSVHYKRAEEPRLFSDEQLGEFFEILDAGIRVTETFPYNDIVFPIMLRLIYCCGLRSSEACNLTLDDVDLARGKLSIYRSKGFKDREIFMSDDVCELCQRFHEAYSKTMPGRTYFFQPSQTRYPYKSSEVGKVFDAVLKKTYFYKWPGKKFTPHGLRHLFAVQNIKKCAENGEDFANWIQYLCKHMGHKNISYTMYYLHITSQLFPIYSEKLRLLEERIGIVHVEE